MRLLFRVLTLALAATLVCAGAASARSHGPNLRLTNPTTKSSADQISATVTLRNSGDRRARTTKVALKAGSITLATVSAPSLKTGAKPKRLKITGFTRLLKPGTYSLKLCADATKRVKERKESDNCRSAGRVTVATPAPGAPAGSIPTAPIPFSSDERLYLAGGGGYWAWVPAAYDATHQTPTKLFVWLHGCGGENKWDIYNVAPAPTGNYIAIAPDGREGACWDTGQDPARVIAAIDDARTHFNISPQRVVLGGYSSGGDLSYRTAYYSSTRIAGVISENTAPFANIGVSTGQAIAAATFKFRVVHLHHTEDNAYTTAIVEPDITALQNAGFPTTYLTRPGNHWDNDTPTTGTNHDLKTILLPYLAEDWTSPGF